MNSADCGGVCSGEEDECDRCLLVFAIALNYLVKNKKDDLSDVVKQRLAIFSRPELREAQVVKKEKTEEKKEKKKKSLKKGKHMSKKSKGEKVSSHGKIRVRQFARGVHNPNSKGASDEYKAPGWNVITAHSRGIGSWKTLSPFLIGPVVFEYNGEEKESYNMENFWQSRKVYKNVVKQNQKSSNWVWPAEKHIGKDGLPNDKWDKWSDSLIAHEKAVRRPNGRNIPDYAWWNGRKLGLIESRKEIYIPFLQDLYRKSSAYKNLLKMVKSGTNIIIVEPDGPKHELYPVGMDVDYETLVELQNVDRMKDFPGAEDWENKNQYVPYGHGYVIALTLLEDLGEKVEKETKSSKKSKKVKDIKSSKTSKSSTTKVVDVHVSCIRPEYKTLKEWMKDPNNVYIGRRGIVFDENKERFPKKDSIFANPFKADKKKKDDKTDEDKLKDNKNIIRKYRKYMTAKLEESPELVEELRKLQGKNLGCWCVETYPKEYRCHGHVLLKLMKKFL